MENHILDKPVVGICYLVHGLQASILGDKVSIALNLLDLGIYFHGTVFSENHCRYIFMLLALAVGDPLAICCSGNALENGISERTSNLNMGYLQWLATLDLVHFSNLYPRLMPALSTKIDFQHGRMIVKTVILPELDRGPSEDHITRSQQFLESIFEDPEILASMEPEDWAHPVLDNAAFLQNGIGYLACALELGPDWMSTALTDMGCSPDVRGLRPGYSGIGDSLWRSAREHLFLNNDRNDGRKSQIVDFLTSALQHTLMLGKTAQRIATVTLPCRRVTRAIVAVPESQPAQEILLAVPVLLVGAENTFIKRLWLLRKEGELNTTDVYSIQSKGYLWGCRAVCGEVDTEPHQPTVSLIPSVNDRA
jgi:hypothetical protein